MDRKKAKELYELFKQNANFVAFNMYFDDQRKQLFVKQFPISHSILLKYSDFFDHTWSKNENTINKGHPIIGAILGNEIGGFGAGFVGALAGQRVSGKHIDYVSDLELLFFLNEPSDQPVVSFRIFNGSMKKGWLWGQYQKQIKEIDDRLCHIEGRQTKDEEMKEMDETMKEIWKS